MVPYLRHGIYNGLFFLPTFNPDGVIALNLIALIPLLEERGNAVVHFECLIEKY